MERSPTRRASLVALAALLPLLAPVGTAQAAGGGIHNIKHVGTAQAAGGGIHNIKHVVMIMQENRSFDSYFGTYPGANGIPANVCVPDPLNGGCVRPFHDPSAINTGGPHGTESSIGDIDGGRMDGFVGQAERGLKCSSTDPSCSACNTGEGAEAQRTCIDVMGYHDAREIPNYWAYAHNFVLQDHMFESAASWSLPEHLYLVSGWSAVCPNGGSNPLECVGSLDPVHPGASWNGPIVPGKATYSLTDLTYLLHRANVTWRYYVLAGDEPDCQLNEAVTCEAVAQDYQTPGIWNPLPDFTDVAQDGQLGNIQPLVDFYKAVHVTGGCGLPAVSWINPNIEVSEHPPSSIAKGQAYVTTLINSIMRSPCWSSSAIFLSWDDWGGFYDHVQPPAIDASGYGLRVPGLVISPYAKAGYIDHQQLSHDAYLKFIEDDFLAGARLNPKTDGRPDNRPGVREEAPGLGDLSGDFNFNQPPREPLLLPPEPPPGPRSEPPGGPPNAPGVVTLPVSQLTPTSATLNATVDSNEAPVSACNFEYGRSSAYGTTLPCTPIPGPGELSQPVSAALQGLTAGTTYYFRIVARNSGGTTYGAPQAFTTARTTGLPEGGRCARVANGTGGYAGGECTSRSPSNTGAYEWRPGSTVELELRAPTGALGPPGAWQVGCGGGAAIEGHMTGARTLRATLTLKGCSNSGVKSSCQSAGANRGEIKSHQLEGEVRFIAGGANPSVGVDLAPNVLSFPTLMEYECGSSSGAGFNVSETGSVIGQLGPLDTMSSKLTLTYTAGERQIPEKLEGQPPDTLVATVRVNGGGTLEKPSVWSLSGAGALPESLEVKAIE